MKQDTHAIRLEHHAMLKRIHQANDLFSHTTAFITKGAILRGSLETIPPEVPSIQRKDRLSII